MRFARLTLFGFCALFAILPGQVRTASGVPSYQQFLSPASPLEIVSARKVDRLAWTAFEEGRRNVYTATAPAFTPVRLTNFMKDDGVDVSGRPHIGRRIDGGIRPRQCTESRRLDRQPERQSRRPGEGGMGGANRRGFCLPSGGRFES
jgi:hypothetical protein